jgi:uncharacterized protein (DUF305 family)
MNGVTDVDAAGGEAAPEDRVTGTAAEALDDDLELAPIGGLNWPRVVVLVLAVAFLAGTVGWYVGRGRAPGKGSVDVGFLRDMTTHHEQALQMAVLELTNGSDPVVEGFAREVLIFQDRDLGLMAAELDDWGYTGDRGDTAMAWMHMPVPAASMPGLATDEQMAALKAARGRDADALFLELMAAHHRGGIHMASYAAEHAKTGDVRGLAASIAHNQAVEINEYRDVAIRNGYPVDIAPAG